jgi:hypothetical protein
LPPNPLTATLADAADDDEPFLPADYKYTFDWQRLRDEYETTGRRERCEVRNDVFKPTRRCPGPYEMAGRAIESGGRSTTITAIRIDRGAHDMITTDWMVALLDDDGHPITPWAPILKVQRYESYADVEIHFARAPRYKNVGMRIDQRLLDQRARENGRQ